MAKKKQIGRRVEGWKAKSWYKVYTPDNIGKAYIGDTVANEPEKLMGRVITTQLSDIASDYSKQHVKMKFSITSVGGDAAYTDFIGHEVTRDYIRSLIKRRTSRIDAIVSFVTQDGRKARLTVTCFTLSRANDSQQHEIRRLLIDETLALGTSSDLNLLVNGIITGDISKEFFKKTKEIFPTRRVEIIKSKVELPKKV
ncbi:MAG: 30S ribosomal protein S3ae [Methanomicrobiales archaeon]|jgi:small subunit ribosomal protein S3Ae|nr:30S ribosomal protein S3ae [Methanomicrobiales archaeon]